MGKDRRSTTEYEREYDRDYEDDFEYDTHGAARSKCPGIAVIAFVVTLVAVLSVGGIFLLIMNSVRTQKSDNTAHEALSEWELIPETAKENKKDTAEQTEQVTETAEINIPEEDIEYTHVITTLYDDSITIGFAGDILFDTNYAVGNAFNRNGNSASGVVGSSLLARMNAVDIMMLNNEFPYSQRGAPREGKTFAFRAKPESAAILNEMGVDIVGLANNHAYDYGEDALTDTISTLDNVGVEHVGAGLNIDEASHPVYYITQNGLKIAFICATQIERLQNPDTREATATSPGVFRCLDDTALLDRIRTAKEKDAFVVVFIHWGTESTTEIDYLQADQAKDITEAGADLIIGAHPHVLQKIEYVNDVPVVYSLGNYIFNSKTQDTCMMIATIGADRNVSLQMIPAIQSDCKVMEAFDSEKQRILGNMQAMSPGIRIDSEGNITR